MTANPAAETHRRLAKISWFQALICLFLIAIALVCVYPMWYTLIISISDKAKAMAGEVYILPKGFNLIAYRKLLSDTTFFDAFFVSVKRVVLGCALNMALMLLTAYPLAMPENRFPRKKLCLVSGVQHAVLRRHDPGVHQHQKPRDVQHHLVTGAAGRAAHLQHLPADEFL